MAEIVEAAVTGPKEYVANRFASSKDDGSFSRYTCASVEQADKFNRNIRQALARSFWRRCTFNNVFKTYILSSGEAYPPLLVNSFGLTWVAVHGMDKSSIAVVTRHRDLDMKCVSKYHQSLPKSRVVGYVTASIISDVEALAYGEDFPEWYGLRMTKPFSVVSVFPGTKTGELACSHEYDMEKAVKFLSGKMECEPVITLDDAIKTAISGFKHLCQEELKAEDYRVSFLDTRTGGVHQMVVPDIEKHLAAINECSGSRKRKREADGLTSLCD